MEADQSSRNGCAVDPQADFLPLSEGSRVIQTSLMAPELRYLRLQTLLSGLGLLISATLSIASIWIGIALNQANERQQEVAKHEKLRESCLTNMMTFMALSTEHGQTSDTQQIRFELINACKDAGVRFSIEDPVQLTIDQMKTDVENFLDWTQAPIAGRIKTQHLLSAPEKSN